MNSVLCAASLNKWSDFGSSFSIRNDDSRLSVDVNVNFLQVQGWKAFDRVKTFVLSLKLDIIHWSASKHGCFNPGERFPGIYCRDGYMCPRINLSCFAENTGSFKKI